MPVPKVTIRIRNGKYTGMLMTRVPAKQLKWMANRDTDEQKKEAIEELERRHIQQYDITLTAHAIDKASIECLAVWQKERTSDQEGLYSWLSRVCADITVNLDEFKGVNGVRFFRYNMVFVFDFTGVNPKLITVYPQDRKVSREYYDKHRKPKSRRRVHENL